MRRRCLGFADQILTDRHRVRAAPDLVSSPAYSGGCRRRSWSPVRAGTGSAGCRSPRPLQWMKWCRGNPVRKSVDISSTPRHLLDSADLRGWKSEEVPRMERRGQASRRPRSSAATVRRRDRDVTAVTIAPFRVNSQKVIGWPDRAAIPSTTTFALAPIAVALPPRSAPSASAHHSASACTGGDPAVRWRPAGSWSPRTGCCRRCRTAEPRRPGAAWPGQRRRRRWPSVTSPASRSITPDLTSAPTTRTGP